MNCPPTKLDSFLLSIYNTSKVKNKFKGTQYAGQPFIQMVQETPYADVMEDEHQTYSVYLDKTNLHWMLLLKSTVSSLPYITLEISTLNMIDLLTVMKIISETECTSKKLTHIGNYSGKLSTFCLTADKVREAMDRYELLHSNCQHFCNNLAYQFDMKVYNPTCSAICNIPAVTVMEILKDERSTDTQDLMQIQVVCTRGNSFRYTPQVVQKNVARAVAAFTGVKGYGEMVVQATDGTDGMNEQIA